MAAVPDPFDRRRFLALGAAAGAAALVGCSAENATAPATTTLPPPASGSAPATTAAPVHLAPAGGYFASPWPGEDGGPDRNMRPRSPLDFSLQEGQKLGATGRVFPISNLVITRAPGEVYLQGSTGLGPRASGYLERIHPESLEALHRSPDLDAGGQFWAGA